MLNIKELEKYIDYRFSSSPCTGVDYIAFQNKYIRYLRGVCQTNGWELVRVLRNHYCFSVFMRCQDKYVYLSISDVRGFHNEWHTDILVRTAKSEKDYTGGQNTFTTLPKLQSSIAWLLEVAA